MKTGKPSRPTIVNLSTSQTDLCPDCELFVDGDVATSSLKLKRDFGSITSSQCTQMRRDYLSTFSNPKTMTFQDFFDKLQRGEYAENTAGGDIALLGHSCVQKMFSEEDAQNIKSPEDYIKNTDKLKTVRMRKVTLEGGFSSETKAKYTLSLPVKVQYAYKIAETRATRNALANITGTWAWTTTTLPQKKVEYRDFTISVLSLYHPAPLRVENIQYDAVLSLNDPSEESSVKQGQREEEGVVILIPLKSSNANTPSTNFFSKFVKHVVSVSQPDSVTGTYGETDIPTGNDWNIKNVFTIKKSGELGEVKNAYYSWTSVPMYAPTEKNEGGVITRGWEPVGRKVRYFMLEDPVAISASDLATLTRSLPATNPTDAIHPILDSTVVNYKQGVCPETTPARETMANQSSSKTTGGGLASLLTDENGDPLSDSCDPFANNARKVLENPSGFTPMMVFNMFYKVLVVIAVALGAWIAMYLVANKDYDYKFKDFSDDAGKVVGTLAKQASDRAKETATVVSQMPKLPSISQLMAIRKGNIPAGLSVPGAAPPPTQ